MHEKGGKKNKEMNKKKGEKKKCVLSKALSRTHIDEDAKLYWSAQP